ncbi:hemerythrin domain-containing protein [Bdellovibrio sp. HCB274]|uniref:hemerythrin domain-containing protein n=1 Tax=Bdellovibrio sp. HCB274 TaxID=3394361 RepID=UPI0039B49D49
MEQLSQQKSHPDDIIQIIKADHKPLKDLLLVLKDEEASFLDKKNALSKFSILFEAHAKPEQETLYERMKRIPEFMMDTAEGELEHRLATQICKDMNTTTSERSFMSKAKVLAEMVSQHIRVEERDLLPDFEAATTLDERIELGRKYRIIQKQIESLQISERHLPPSSSMDGMQG